MATKKQNAENNNVHPNSRAARGDEAIEAERAARAAAAPAPVAEPVDNSQEVADLTAKVEELEVDLEVANDAKVEAEKATEAALADVETAQKEAAAAVERAEKAEARLAEHEAKAVKPGTTPNQANGGGTAAASN